MAVSVKVRQVANPGGRRRRTRARVKVGRNRMGRFTRVRNTRRKRVKRVKTNRRRTSVNRRRTNRRRGVRVTTNPKRRRRAMKRVAKRRTRRVVRNRRRKRNSPLLIELGAINPRRERRKGKVAKRRTRRTTNTRRRRYNRRRRSNPVAVTHRRRRRTNRRSRARRHNRRRNGRRRNPMGMTSGDMLVSVLGGLIGMAATKFLPTLVPASLTSGNPFMSVVVTGVGAFACGMIADKIAPKYGKAVLVGGLIQTGSTTLNAFAPSLASSLGVSGVGDIIPTQPFPVPNNQLRPVTVMVPAGSGGAGGGSGAGVGNIGAGIKRRIR